jgi:hypothetical protein
VPAPRALYLYAITDRPRAPLPPLRGLGDAPVSMVGYRRLAAIVSGHEPEAVSPTEGAFWQHEAVCEALMDGRTVLPARFGLMFSSEDQLRSELAARYDELVRAIGRLAGRVELGVRVVWKESREHSRRSDGTEEGSGRAYLEARLAERRKATSRRP